MFLFSVLTFCVHIYNCPHCYAGHVYSGKRKGTVLCLSVCLFVCLFVCPIFFLTRLTYKNARLKQLSRLTLL